MAKYYLIMKKYIIDDQIIQKSCILIKYWLKKCFEPIEDVNNDDSSTPIIKVKFKKLLMNMKYKK